MADIKIYGRLRNATVENVIAQTDQVMDGVEQQTQEAINKAHKGQIAALETKVAGALKLGETADTAFAGDKGKAAYDHAMAKGKAFATGLYKITTNAEGHVTAAVAATKEDITALGIPGTQTVIPQELTDLAAKIREGYSVVMVKNG